MFHMQSTYLLKLTVRLTLQFVSVSPFNIHLGQTRSLRLKVQGSKKHFLGVLTFVFIVFFNKNFFGKTKFGAQKNLVRIAPKYPLCQQV